MSNKKRCFVIMPFSTPEGYEENHFTKIYEQIIKPAIKQADLKPERVDENILSTDIVAKIFKGLTECEMAICDLSSRNPNVLYELGIRQAYNKPVLLIKDEKTERIFDVGGLTTIQYESNRLYENVISAVEEISEALKEHLENKESVVDIIKSRLGSDIYEATIPSAKDMDFNQQIVSLLSSLTGDIDLIKRRMSYSSYNYTPDRLFTNNGVSQNERKRLLLKVLKMIDELNDKKTDDLQQKLMLNKLYDIRRKNLISDDDYDFIRNCEISLKF